MDPKPLHPKTKREEDRNPKSKLKPSILNSQPQQAKRDPRDSPGGVQREDRLGACIMMMIFALPMTILIVLLLVVVVVVVAVVVVGAAAAAAVAVAAAVVVVLLVVVVVVTCSSSCSSCCCNSSSRASLNPASLHRHSTD